jgi:hypothetical protein
MIINYLSLEVALIITLGNNGGSINRRMSQEVSYNKYFRYIYNKDNADKFCIQDHNFQIYKWDIVIEELFDGKN